MQTPASSAHVSPVRPVRAARPRRSPAFAFFCTYAAFVAYATLLPFQFFTDPDSIRSKTHLINWDPRYLTTGDETPLTDLVANVLFFIPVGFIGVHGQRPRRPGILILRSAAAGFGLSLLVEIAQLFTPSRNPATSDVLTNTLGAALGAGLAVFVRIQLEHAVLRRALAWTRREPLLPVLVAFALLVGIASLVPFDLGLSVSQLRSALRRAEFDPRVPLGNWAGEIPRMLQFTVLAGVAWHVSRRLFQGGRLLRLAICAAALGVFAVGLEVAQLFIRSHACSAVDAIAGLWGATVGVAVAAVLSATRRVHYGWWLVAVACLASLAVQALAPFHFDFSLAAVRARVNPHTLIPYSSYYYKATVAAVADFLDGLLAFVPLGFVLARASGARRAGELGTGARAALCCAAIALALELLQLGLPKRYPEVSDVLTAALGGGLGAFAWRWFAALGLPAAASPNDANPRGSTYRTSIILIAQEPPSASIRAK